MTGCPRGSRYGVAALPVGRNVGLPRLPFCLLGFFFVVLKAHLIILRLRTQCPSLGENAWDKGWVMDDPIPLLSAVTIISYPSCSSSVSLSSGPVLWGSE